MKFMLTIVVMKLITIIIILWRGKNATTIIMEIMMMMTISGGRASLFGRRMRQLICWNIYYLIENVHKLKGTHITITRWLPSMLVTAKGCTLLHQIEDTLMDNCRQSDNQTVGQSDSGQWMPNNMASRNE